MKSLDSEFILTFNSQFFCVDPSNNPQRCHPHRWNFPPSSGNLHGCCPGGPVAGHLCLLGLSIYDTFRSVLSGFSPPLEARFQLLLAFFPAPPDLLKFCLCPIALLWVPPFALTLGSTITSVIGAQPVERPGLLP